MHHSLIERIFNRENSLAETILWHPPPAISRRQLGIALGITFSFTLMKVIIMTHGVLQEKTLKVMNFMFIINSQTSASLLGRLR